MTSKITRKREPLEDRFLRRVNKTDGCWLWSGAHYGGGYGAIPVCRNGKWGTGYAHRVSYELYRGPIPSGLYVCHACDNRLCVNPDHLWLGTHQENQADMGRKGRTHSPAKVLSDADVARIRELLAEGRLYQREIAAQFGVGRTLISRIGTGARRARS